MCTQDDRRWPVGLHGTPERFGKLVEYNLFDASFFSVHGKQAQVSHALLLQSVCTVKSHHLTCHASKICCRSQQCMASGTTAIEVHAVLVQCKHDLGACL